VGGGVGSLRPHAPLTAHPTPTQMAGHTSMQQQNSANTPTGRRYSSRSRNGRRYSSYGVATSYTLMVVCVGVCNHVSARHLYIELRRVRHVLGNNVPTHVIRRHFATIDDAQRFIEARRPRSDTALEARARIVRVRAPVSIGARRRRLNPRSSRSRSTTLTRRWLDTDLRLHPFDNPRRRSSTLKTMLLPRHSFLLNLCTKFVRLFRQMESLC